MPPHTQPISVSRITQMIKTRLEEDDTLQQAVVTGEIADFKVAGSGHAYFSIKDAYAVLNCVMWRSSVKGLNFRPEAGNEVVVQGKIEVYPPSGRYQLITSHMAKQGIGRIYEEYERRKREFARRGWFDKEWKLPISKFPERLAVVTSSSGAALHDVHRTLQNRWPGADVILFPSLVQGPEAPSALARALSQVLVYHKSGNAVDTVLIVRGGGSMEDLWAFNDERIVEAVHHFPLPVITGVGHEPDTTLVDYVADLRAATPTAAAEAAVPDQAEVKELVAAQWMLISSRVNAQVKWQRNQLDALQHRSEQSHPRRLLALRTQQLDFATAALNDSIRRHVSQAQSQLKNLVASLRALDPEAVLNRGFSIVRDQEGVLVTGPAQTVAGDPLEVKARDGVYAVLRQAGPPNDSDSV